MKKSSIARDVADSTKGTLESGSLENGGSILAWSDHKKKRAVTEQTFVASKAELEDLSTTLQEGLLNALKAKRMVK